jgi:hypothetical protein
VSWLFAALIPVLLMLATFGLERLEASLATDDRTDEIDELVAQTPPNVDRAAHATPPATPSWAPRTANAHLHGHAAFTGLAALDDEPGLPTMVCRRETANPQFQPTRHANPV